MQLKQVSVDAESGIHWQLMSLASLVRKRQNREALPSEVRSTANIRTRSEKQLQQQQHRRSTIVYGGRRRTECEKEPAESSGFCSSHWARGHAQSSKCQKRRSVNDDTLVPRSFPSNTHHRKLASCKGNERGDHGSLRKSPASSPWDLSLQQPPLPPPPRVLRIVSPNTRKGLEGDYVLEQERPNGQPLWKHTSGVYWLFSTPKGRWSIAGEDVANEDFSRSSGWICQELFHGGLTPDQAPSGWMLWDGSGFLADCEIEVTAPEQNVNRRACWPPCADGQNASSDYNPLFSNANRSFPLWQNRS